MIQGNINQSSGDTVSLAVDFLLPGTVIGSPLYDRKGNKILDAKIPFTEEIINKLKEARIDRVFYKQGGETPKQTPEPSAQTSPAAAVPQPRTIIQPKIFQLSEQVSNEISENIRTGSFIQTTGVHQLVELLFKMLTAFGKFPPELLLEKNANDPEMSHHLNVCILSMELAMKHGFENTLVKQIGIGAYLHDIGKQRLPRELTAKKNGYTPDEIEMLKKHTTMGFELIKLNGQLSSIVRKIVLLHHEATNGTGYPLALTEKDVGYYPYIISLANIFDNLTTNKPFRNAYPLRDTLSMLIQTSGKKLPAYLVQLFVKHVSLSLSPHRKSSVGKHARGSFVILNTQEVAQILNQNPSNPDKPTIRIIKDPKGHSIDPPIEVDLINDVTRLITETLNEEVQKQLIRRFPVD